MERDENGKFVKGNPGGPGRPKKEREERFYEITLETVTFDEWREVIRKALAQAKRGDPQARKWLGDYLMGQPVQRHEVAGENGGAIQVDHFIRMLEVVYGDKREKP